MIFKPLPMDVKREDWGVHLILIGSSSASQSISGNAGKQPPRGSKRKREREVDYVLERCSTWWYMSDNWGSDTHVYVQACSLSCVTSSLRESPDHSNRRSSSFSATSGWVIYTHVGSTSKLVWTHVHLSFYPRFRPSASSDAVNRSKLVVAFSSRARILGECLTFHFPPIIFF